jgi:2-desacetyl-2-hydroxyethyl bacteriochlorophyllide A dehydrogenase
MTRSPETVEASALVARPGGEFGVEPVLLPGPGRDNIVVQIAYSGVSIGTEFGALSGKIDWGGFPMVTGYMATGTVSMVGSEVTGFAPGDRVYVRHNEGLRLAQSGEAVNCRDGLHCSVASLDPRGDHGGAILPDGVDLDVGSLFTVLSVGLHGADMAGVCAGDSVVVIGLGTVGLGVVAAAAARGARVVGVDLRERCRAVARQLGASETVQPDGGQPDGTDTAAIVRSIVGEAGADFVFEATGHKSLIDLGVELTRPFGTLVWQGHYGEGPVQFKFVRAHHKQLRMLFPCDDGLAESRAALLRSVRGGRLPVELLITDRLSPAEAAGFFGHVSRKGSGDSISPVIAWA